MVQNSVIQFVKNHGYDFYLCSIFAADNIRNDLLNIISFHIEISNISKKTTEPIAGLMRLQWWRESIEDIYQYKQCTNHFILHDLYDVIHKYELPKHLFIDYFNAREFNYSMEVMNNVDELITYAKDVMSSIINLILKVANAKNHDTYILGNNLGIAYCIISLIQQLKSYSLNNALWIPLSLLNKYQISQQDIFSKNQSGQMAFLIKELVLLAQDFNYFDLKKIESNAKFVFFLQIIIKQIIKKITNNHFHIFHNNFEYSRIIALIKMYWYNLK